MAAKDVDAAGGIGRRKRDGCDQGRRRSHRTDAQGAVQSARPGRSGQPL